MNVMPIRMLVVDDHQLFRKALSALLKTFNFAIKIVEASNGSEALEILGASHFDIMLLDVEMPKLNGIETLKQLRAGGNQIKTIILTQHNETILVHHLLHLGANSFLLKDCSPDELEKNILSVIEKGHYIDGLILKSIEDGLAHPFNPTLHMTVRERQILIEMKDGKSNKAIAANLGLAQTTVEGYRKHLMKKTNSKNSLELISLAYRTGLLNKFS